MSELRMLKIMISEDPKLNDHELICNMATSKQVESLIEGFQEAMKERDMAVNLLEVVMDTLQGIAKREADEKAKDADEKEEESK